MTMFRVQLSNYKTDSQNCKLKALPQDSENTFLIKTSPQNCTYLGYYCCMKVATSVCGKIKAISVCCRLD